MTYQKPVKSTEAIIPTINGKRFVCEVCKERWGLFYAKHDSDYGRLLVCNGCGAEYQSVGAA